MSEPYILSLNDSGQLWISIDTTMDPSIKYFSIYDDKYKNSLNFEIDDNRMRALADFINKYLENK